MSNGISNNKKKTTWVEIETVIIVIWLIGSWMAAVPLLRNRVDVTQMRFPNGDLGFEAEALKQDDFNGANFWLGAKFVVAPLWSPLVLIGKAIRP